MQQVDQCSSLILQAQVLPLVIAVHILFDHGSVLPRLVTAGSVMLSVRGLVASAKSGFTCATLD
jgi:hypothetical protein